MCTPTRNSGYCQVAAYNSTQHTAISDMCVYMYFCLRVCTRVSWFIVRVRGVFCECVLCVECVCVAQSSVWLRECDL